MDKKLNEAIEKLEMVGEILISKNEKIKELELINKELKQQLSLGAVGQQSELLKGFGGWFNEFKIRNRPIGFVTVDDINEYLKTL